MSQPHISKTQDSTSSLRKSALWYGRHGWHVIPLYTPLIDQEPIEHKGGLYPPCSCGNQSCGKSTGKHPRIADWENKASTNENQIRQWWAKWPDANVGIAAGNSGLLALDADTYKEEFGGLGLTREERETITNLTGNGGEHLIYRQPDGKRYGGSEGDLPAGINVRGHGGQFVAPPSLHYSGNRYQWEEGYGPHEIEPLELPRSIAELLDEIQESDSSDSVTFSDNGSRGKPDLSQYPISSIVRSAIQREPSPSDDRSAIDHSVIGELVWKGAPDDYILGIFEHCPIGQAGKFAEQGKYGKRYIARSITKARKRKAKKEKQSSGQAIEPPQSPSNSFNLYHYRAEDGGVLDAFIDLYGDEWLYVAGFEYWLCWTGTHWAKDESRQIEKQVQELLDRMNQAARGKLKTLTVPGDQERKGDEKIAKAYISATRRSRTRVRSIIEMAAAHQAITPEELNQGNVLNLANRTLDLDSFEHRAHRREDYLTYCLPYDFDPGASCPRHDRFLREVLVAEYTHEPDAELIELYLEYLGFSLTNDTSFETMAFITGNGGNGKTVATTVIQNLAGPLAISVNFHTLGTSGNYDLARLPGSRVVFSTESDRGGKMAESLIRRLVSGETLPARPIYGRPFEFNPVAKIWWAMNDKPIIHDTSDATWRRMLLIPFYKTFSEEERDTELISKLIEELPGILNRALEGLKRLRANGRFTESAVAKEAANEYRRESNPIDLWREERTIELDRPLTRGGELYEDYQEWTASNGRKPVNATNFGRELKKLPSVESKASNYVLYNLGLLVEVAEQKPVQEDMNDDFK